MRHRRPRPSRATRIATRVACLLLPCLALACGDDDPVAPSAPTPLDLLSTRIVVSPAEFTLGDTAWVYVVLRNPTAFAITMATPDGCPLVEPVVGKPNGGLRTFAPSCIGDRAGLDPARASLSLAPGDSAVLHFPFTGQAPDFTRVDGTSSPIAGTCSFVGPYEISLITSDGDGPGLRLLTTAPNRAGGVVRSRGVVRAGDTPPATTCTS